MRWKHLVVVLMVSLGLFLSGTTVSAQGLKERIWNNFNSAAEDTYRTYTLDGTRTNTFKESLTRIINLMLGVLGTIAVFLIIYSGFLWMTAGGNEDQVSQSKTIIKQVVVGILVLSLAYALVAFVVSLVSRGTTTLRRVSHLAPHTLLIEQS